MSTDDAIPAWVKNSSPTKTDIQLGWARMNARRGNPCNRPEPTTRYHKYLESHRWQRVRVFVMVAACWTCARCGKGADDVHHLTYERLGRERLSDLEPICRSCHRAEHGIVGDLTKKMLTSLVGRVA